MARTAGVPKADKSLKGPEIDWTGHPIRDGRGYYGEKGNVAEVVKVGAFPPAVPSGPDDVSRRRFSPAEALAREMAAQGQIASPKSQISSVTYRDGAEVTEEKLKGESRKQKPNSLKLMWERLRADPVAMAAFLEKKNAGLAKWWAKKKGK